MHRLSLTEKRELLAAIKRDGVDALAPEVRAAYARCPDAAVPVELAILRHLITMDERADRSGPVPAPVPAQAALL